MALDEHDAVVRDVAAAYLKQPSALVGVGRVDQVARGEDRAEAAAEVHVLDAGVDRLDPGGVGEHRGRLVDAGDTVAQVGERAGEAADAAAEVEDRRARLDRRVEHRRHVVGRQAEIDRDRAAIGGDVVGHGGEAHVRAVMQTKRAPRRATERPDGARLSANAPGKP